MAYGSGGCACCCCACDVAEPPPPPGLLRSLTVALLSLSEPELPLSLLAPSAPLELSCVMRGVDAMPCSSGGRKLSVCAVALPPSDEAASLLGELLSVAGFVDDVVAAASSSSALDSS